MCRSANEYQRINPTSQVSLFSSCQEQCDGLVSIEWNIYQGRSLRFLANQTSTSVQWQLLNQTDLYDQIWFFGNLIHRSLLRRWTIRLVIDFVGRSQRNFTAASELFVSNGGVKYWRFEVIYRFSSMASGRSVMSFTVNDPPENGTCSISPSNGTTSTEFTLECVNWVDTDGIQDYSLYGNGSLLLIYVVKDLSVGRMGR